MADLGAVGVLDAAGYVTATPDTIVELMAAEPESFPTLASVPRAARRDVFNQLKVVYADHQMFSDWSARTLDFFESHLE